MRNTLRKRVIYLATFLLILIISIIAFISLRNHMSYKKSVIINRSSEFFINSDKIIEITPEKTLYEHDFKGKAKKVCENTDIIYIQNNLQINKDGSIYFNENDKYSERKIAQIPGAISGSYDYDHISIVTKDGKLYLSSILDRDNKEKFNSKMPEDLKLITDIPKVKKVVCDDVVTWFLSEDGEVYVRGKLLSKEFATFTKINCENKVIDIDGSSGTLVALDEKNNVHVIGDVSFDGWDLSYEFKQKYKNISSISALAGYGVAIRKDGKVEFWGTRTSGKGNETYSGKVKNINNASKVFNNNSVIIVLEDNILIHTNVN